MIAEARLHDIRARFEFLEAKLASGAAGDEIAAISKEYAGLKPVIETIEAYSALAEAKSEAEAMLADPEMKALAEEELERVARALPEAEHAVRLALLPKDAADDRAAILEIRPGTGGEEAALFAADLFRMYQRYAEAKGWRVDVIERAQAYLRAARDRGELEIPPGVSYYFAGTYENQVRAQKTLILVVPMALLIIWSLPGVLRSAGVSVTPARIALALTPLGASSKPIWRMCDSSAHFAAATEACSTSDGAPTNVTTDRWWSATRWVAWSRRARW